MGTHFHARHSLIERPPHSLNFHQQHSQNWAALQSVERHRELRAKVLGVAAWFVCLLALFALFYGLQELSAWLQGWLK